MKTTVVYYTSNRENILFERRIRRKLLSVIGDIPLISVSHKPICFGINICSGFEDVSEGNIISQMLAGCEVAKTPFVTFAEADTLYPPEYFQYKPKELNKRYWFEPVYILYINKDHYYYKGRSDSAHMAGREYVIKLLKEAIREGRTMKWRGEDRPIKVELNNPIVNIKTGNGMRPKTQTGMMPVGILPYWGTVKDIERNYFNGKF